MQLGMRQRPAVLEGPVRPTDADPCWTLPAAAGTNQGIEGAALYLDTTGRSSSAVVSFLTALLMASTVSGDVWRAPTTQLKALPTPPATKADLQSSHLVAAASTTSAAAWFLSSPPAADCYMVILCCNQHSPRNKPGTVSPSWLLNLSSTTSAPLSAANTERF